MNIYRLSGPDLLEPFWFNSVRSGQHPCVVSEDSRTVTLAGVPLLFRDSRPAPGAAVKVWLNAQGFFVCATDEDLAADCARRLADEETARNALVLRRNAMRDEATAFNSRIQLPVKWDVGIKDVLSGLSESSWGDGRNASTVEHIYLLEPLKAGRLVRASGDFLCSSSSSANGKRWSASIVERNHDGYGAPYQPRVTCKACLAIAQRWMVPE